MSVTQIPSVVGLQGLSPLAVSLLIDRSKFDTLIVHDGTRASTIEDFIEVDHAGRTTAVVLSSLDVLGKRSISEALSGVERLVVIDTIGVMLAMGVNVINHVLAGQGRYVIRKFTYDEFSRELSAEQDLSALEGPVTLPHLSPRRPANLKSGHLHLVLPVLSSSTDTSALLEGDDSDVEAVDVDLFLKSTVDYALGVAGRQEFSKSSNAFIRYGGNAAVTALLTKYLRSYRKLVQKAFWIAAKGEISLLEVAKHFDPDGRLLIKQELATLFEYTSDQELPHQSAYRMIPKELKAFSGGTSRRDQPTLQFIQGGKVPSWQAKPRAGRMYKRLAAFLGKRAGRPVKVDRKKAEALRRRIR